MFHFMEGSFKKCANSVCNMLQLAIYKELQAEYFNKIFLYSDAAEGGGGGGAESKLFNASVLIDFIC